MTYSPIPFCLLQEKLVDWLLNYKTTDGKPVNQLDSLEPTSPAEAVSIINDVNKFYLDLVKPGSSKNTYGFALPSSTSQYSTIPSSSSSSTSSTGYSSFTSSSSVGSQDFGSSKKSKVDAAYGVTHV